MEEAILVLGGAIGGAILSRATHLWHFVRRRRVRRQPQESDYDERIDQLSELARDRFIVHRANTDTFFRGRFRQSAPDLYTQAAELLGWPEEA